MPWLRPVHAQNAAGVRTEAALGRFRHGEVSRSPRRGSRDWRADLAGSIEKILAPDFLAASPQPSSNPISCALAPRLEVRRVTFSQQIISWTRSFHPRFAILTRAFTTIHTAEFQVTRIDAQPGGATATLACRYELVGSGAGFHREQRVGVWDLEWDPPAGSVSPAPLAIPAKRRAPVPPSLGTKTSLPTCSARLRPTANKCCAALTIGAPFSTAACGIDIYGHNGVSVGDIDGDGFDDLYVCQPARPSQSAVSQSRRWNLRGHH